MADIKVTDLTALAVAPADTDEVHIVDVSDNTDSVAGTSKRITIANLIKAYVEALASYFNVSSDTSDTITEGTTQLFLTSTERTAISTNSSKISFDATSSGRLANTSGTNTGDQTSVTGNSGTTTAANGIKTATTTVSVSGATAPTSGQILKATSGTNATWQNEATGGTPEGTSILSTGETVGKVLQADGDNTSSWVTLPGGGDALVSNPLSQFASTTSLQLATVLSDETGTGLVVFNDSPALVTPTGIVASDLSDFQSSVTGNTAVLANTAKVSFDSTSSTRLINTSGTNTGDVTLAGTPNYITIVGQVITRALINLTSHVTGILPIANGGTGASTAGTARAALGAGTMSNVVEDTTPQAGGNLDLNGHPAGDATEFDNGNSGTSKTIVWDNGSYQKITMTGNATLTFTAPTLKGRYQMRFIQDATGTRVATFPTILTAGGTGVTLSTAAGSIDIVTFYYDGTSYYAVDSLAFA